MVLQSLKKYQYLLLAFALLLLQSHASYTTPPSPPQACTPEPDKILCPGNAVPANWVIVGREPCLACPGGSTCRQSRIVDLRCRLQGFEVKACPYSAGYTIPEGYDKVGTEPCGGSCADNPGGACVMTIYRKR